MDFLSFFKRYYKKLLFVPFFLSLLVFFINLPQKNQINFFYTLALKNSDKIINSEQTTAYFGETVVGWFKNTSYLKDLKEKYPDLKISAYKQERSNFVVSLTFPDQTKILKLAQDFQVSFRDSLKKYNKKTENKFILLEDGNYRLSSIKTPQFLLFFISFFTLFLLVFLWLFLKEIWQDKLLSVSELEDIFKNKNLKIFKFQNKKNDFKILSSFLFKTKKINFLSPVDFKDEKFVIDLAKKYTLFLDKLFLVEGSLTKSKLSSFLGLSNKMKNLKGHTDLDFKKSFNFNTFLLKNNLYYIPLGNGKKFILENLEFLAEKNKTLVYSVLPDNSELLRLTNSSVFLVIKLGITPKETLKKLALLKTDYNFILID
jgi:hypothetical protein